jgi:PAS domain S-box-containing protein
VPAGLIIYDESVRILHMNHVAEDLVGYSPDEQELDAAQRLRLTLPQTPNGRPFPMERMPVIRALRGEAVQGETTLLHRPPGGKVWLTASAAPIYNDAGRLLGAIATFSDITRLRETQEQLEAANCELEAARDELDAHVHERTAELDGANRTLVEQGERLKVLHDIDRAILASQSPQAIALSAVQGVRRLTGALRATVQTFDRSRDEAEILATDGLYVEAVSAGVVTPLALAPILQEVAQGRLTIVEDLLQYAVAQPEVQRFVEQGLRAIAAFPVVLAPERGTSAAPIGALVLGKAEPGSWSADVIQTAAQVADSMAVALSNARLYSEVEAGREQLQALSRRLVEIQERERHFLADQLYNEAAQVLAGLKFQLNALAQELQGRAAGCEMRETALARLDQLQQMADRVLAELHGLAVNLRPASLDRLGLAPALNQYLREFGAQAGVRVQFEAIGLEAVRLPAAVETALYRISQEALDNAVRHGCPNTLGIGILYVQGRLSLMIEDDGSGFDRAEARRRGALGLLAMRERAEAIGGRLTIESQPNTGTVVIMEVQAHA